MVAWGPFKCYFICSLLFRFYDLFCYFFKPVCGHFIYSLEYVTHFIYLNYYIFLSALLMQIFLIWFVILFVILFLTTYGIIFVQWVLWPVIVYKWHLVTYIICLFGNITHCYYFIYDGLCSFYLHFYPLFNVCDFYCYFFVPVCGSFHQFSWICGPFYVHLLSYIFKDRTFKSSTSGTLFQL